VQFHGIELVMVGGARGNISDDFEYHFFDKADEWTMFTHRIGGAHMGGKVSLSFRLK
jgi:hypothetical protein